jgi:hypothetical protein
MDFRRASESKIFTEDASVMIQEMDNGGLDPLSVTQMF